MNSILLNLNPSKGHFAQFNDSTLGIPNLIGIIVTVIFFAFCLYVGLKVRLSIRNEKKLKKK